MTSQIETITQPEESMVEDQVVEPQPTAFGWLTGEMLVYIILGILAFGIRLAGLGNVPLNDGEAAQALVGLEVYKGGIPVEAQNYSALIVSLNSLAFLLFGVSDASARLGSSLLGAALVLTPIGLRNQLGKLGALIATLLLTFSAASLYWSRVVSGEMGAALGSMMILVGAVQVAEDKVRPGLFIGIGGLILLLISSPSGFTALITLLIVAGMMALIDQQVLTLARARVSQAGVSPGQALFFGLFLLVVLGTAAVFNLTGLASISDLFTNWLGQFGLQLQPGAGYPIILMLIFYEPLILLFGIIGLVHSFVRRQLFDWALVIWFGVVVSLDMVMGGRDGGQVMLAVIPLALLASRSITDLVEQLWANGRFDAEGLFVAFGLILSVFAYISLTSWSKCVFNQPGCDTAWVLPLAGLGLILLLFVIFWFWYEAGMAWRGLGILLLIVAGLISIGASWRLNFGPLDQAPYQPMISRPASTRLLALLDDLRRFSTTQTGSPAALEVAVVGLGDRPLLRWHLRDFDKANYVSAFDEAGPAPVLIAAASAGQPTQGSYVGQDLALTAHWTPQLVEGKDWVRWYLFRFLPNHKPESDQIVLWVRRMTNDE
jgi:hypothetical protein